MANPYTSSLFGCDGRVAVVTGPVGRLGPVWVEALARAGAKVAVVAQPGTRNDPPLLALRDRYDLVVAEADITDHEQLLAARDEVCESLGAPHILVANAGIDHRPAPGAILGLDHLVPGDLAGVITTNVIGTMLTLSAFGAPMVAEGRGSAILIASQYAAAAPNPRLYDHIEPGPFVKNPAYGASKASVVNMARSFAAHWGSSGVRVNALSPGGVHGDQDEQFIRKFSAATPLGRMLEPKELAGPLLFLASDASSYVTGAHLLVDGGYSIW